MTLDPIYLAAFALTSCAAAFALGRFCRNGNSTGAWEGATSTHYEGMAPLGGSACGFDVSAHRKMVDATSEPWQSIRGEPGTRMAVRSVSVHGRGIDEYYLGQPLVVKTINYDVHSLRLEEPSPHADGSEP